MGELPIYFDLFFSDFEVLVIQIFHLLGKSYTKIFYILYDYFMGFCFPNFFLALIIICINEGIDLFELFVYLATCLKLFIHCRSSLV